MSNSNKSLKVVHLISGLTIGGTELQLFRLLTHMDQSLIRNSVISLIPGGAVADWLREAGIPVYSLGMKSGRPNIIGLLKLFWILRSERPQILQTWLYHADLMGVIGAYLAHIPRLVWNIRCSDKDERYNRGLRGGVVKILSYMSRLPDAVIVNSNAGRVLHESLGYKPRRWLKIPNGIDLESFYPNLEAKKSVRNELGLSEDTILIGLVARWDPLKDHATFIHAAQIVINSDHHNVQFVLVGYGVSKNNIEFRTLIDRIGKNYSKNPEKGRLLINKLHALDERKDISRLTAALDIATCSSTGEGFPNVIGEAMASGVPVVSTDVGDVRELIGNAGRVVNRSNPQEMAGAWLELLDLDSNKLRKIGDQARDWIVSNNDIKLISRKYKDFYCDLAFVTKG